MKAILAGMLAAVAVATAALGEDTEQVSLSNPFERPSWLNDAREVGEAARPAKVRPDLRATLLGEASLANVGGKIIEPGEEIGGYRLLSVSEGAAKFSDGERTIEFRVRPKSGDADD